MNTNKVIKSIRGQRLLTQDNIAEKLGVSRQVYNSYENDLLHCDLDLIMKILNVLQADSSEIDSFLNALKQDYLSYNLIEKT